MIILVSNNASGLVHFLAGRYPGSIGWCLSPAGGFKEPREWLPYAIDNGCYAAWESGEPWDELGFMRYLDRCRLSRHKPRWVAVPDSIGDCDSTLRLWERWAPFLRRYGWPLAFVAQDGIEPRSIPKNADVVFIGGTTTWKWRNAGRFAAQCKRVHVGRVNWRDKLEHCEKIGAESCDGSGFFRAGEEGEQCRQLVAFIEGFRLAQGQPELDFNLLKQSRCANIDPL